MPQFLVSAGAIRYLQFIQGSFSHRAGPPTQEKHPMARSRPAILALMGLLSILAGLAGLVLLVLANRQELQAMVLAAQGQAGDLKNYSGLLAQAPSLIYIKFVILALELALAVILIFSGINLLSMHPTARWSSVFAGFCLVVVCT